VRRPVFCNIRELGEKLDLSYAVVTALARRGVSPSVKDNHGKLLFNLSSVIKAMLSNPLERPEPVSAQEAD
jgi:hypothetical protein